MTVDLGEPSVMLYALSCVIGMCVALDLPALSKTFRFLRLRRRLAYAHSRRVSASREPH
jgi:hypothetical protein